jgi:uncharacterized protein YlxW (UPF0749 family)
MRIKSYHLAFGLVGLVLGVLLVLQFKVTSESNKSPQVQRVENLSYKASQVREEHDKKLNELVNMRAELDKLAGGSDADSLKNNLDAVRIEAGSLEIFGPGVMVELNDSNTLAKSGENPNLYILHDEDILKVLNELRASGAEVLAINNERVLSTSEIRCAGPTILINKNQRITPPFVVSAIGNQDNMVNSLNMRGGVIESLEFWGIQVSVKRVPRIVIPPTVSSVSFELAKPVGGSN